MKSEGEKLKPPEARVGVCAGVHARVRARRVHKLSTRAERADGEDVDAHRLNRVRVRDFCSAVELCSLLRWGADVSRGDERLFGRGEGLWRAPTCKQDPESGGPTAPGYIQPAPQTVNERSGELREFGAVGVYCSIEIKALGRDYVPFSSFPNSAGRRKAV